jgi:uncharacterized protein involved in exopolysaccharide biosynthesis
MPQLDPMQGVVLAGVVLLFLLGSGGCYARNHVDRLDRLIRQERERK